jgi:hypothetical protein
MKPVWKWIIGIAVALFVLGSIATPFVMHLFFGYGMMSGYGSSWGMPMFGGFGFGPSTMMGGGFGFMGFGLLFSALIQLGILVLIVLGIIWLIGEIKKQNQHSN